MATELIDYITENDGWISGSYVRDVLIRKDDSYSLSDLDVLIKFDQHNELVSALKRRYQCEENVIDYNEEEQIAHTELLIDGFVVDIFSSEDREYLSPLDFDVNALCWTGVDYAIWWPGPLHGDAEDFYHYSMDVQSIIARAKNKQAVAMIDEWIDDDSKERYYKLVNKGWKVLNKDNAEEFLGI